MDTGPNTTRPRKMKTPPPLPAVEAQYPTPEEQAAAMVDRVDEPPLDAEIAADLAEQAQPQVLEMIDSAIYRTEQVGLVALCMARGLTRVDGQYVIDAIKVLPITAGFDEVWQALETAVQAARQGRTYP